MQRGEGEGISGRSLGSSCQEHFDAIRSPIQAGFVQSRIPSPIRSLNPRLLVQQQSDECQIASSRRGNEWRCALAVSCFDVCALVDQLPGVEQCSLCQGLMNRSL